MRDHKLISGAVAVLIVVLGGWYLFGSSEDRDRTIGGAGSPNAGWPGGPTEPTPSPSDRFRIESDALTAAITAALTATCPPTTPGGTASTPGASPTGTPAPTDTSTPTGTSAPTGGPAPCVTGGASPGVSVEALGRDGTPIRVRWSIDADLPGAQARDKARTDAVKVLTAVKSTADFEYNKVVLTVRYAGAAQQPAVEANYSKATLDGLNLATVPPRKIFDLGDGAKLDRSMRY